jgi:hypothetical protein
VEVSMMEIICLLVGLAVFAMLFGLTYLCEWL